MFSKLHLIPLSIINKITKYVSEINDDTFVITFCEVGKIDRKTNRLCSRPCCKIRTRMYLLLDKEKFEPKLVNHFNIKQTYKKQLVRVNDFTSDGDMFCINSKTITSPGWIGEPDEVRKYDTYVISYKSQHFVTEYAVLKYVCTNVHGEKTCLDGIIVNPELPKKNQITQIEKILFRKYVCYIDGKLIPYDIITIITEY
jgi:hypothetical protein